MIYYFRKQKIFLFVFILSFLNSLILLAPSIFLLLIYNKVLTYQNLNSLTALFIIYLLIMLLGYGLDNLRANIGAIAGKKFIQEIDLFLLKKFPVLKEWSPSKVLQLDMYLQSSYIFYQFEILFGFFNIVFLYFLNPYLSLYALISSIILFVFTNRKTNFNLNDIDKTRIYNSWDFFHAIGLKNKISKLIEFPLDKRFMKKYFDKNTVYNNVKYLKYTLTSGSLVVSSLLIILKGLNPGIMFMVMVLMSRIFQPVELFAIGRKMINTQSKILNSLLSDPSFISFTDRNTKPNIPETFKSTFISIVDLQLIYDKKNDTKSDCFNLDLGKNYLIIGPNGSGKSTFLNTLVGSTLSKNGVVLYNNIPASQLTEKNRLNLFNYMPQGGVISKISLKDYLMLNSNLEIKSIIPLFEHFRILNKVYTSSENWETPLDEFIQNCSPGEIQKLKLIQSTIAIKEWNFFDEPEHFLDGIGVDYLFNHFNKILEKKSSIIMVSHKPSMMEFFDYIIMIDDFLIRTPILKKDFLNNIKIIKGNN